MAVAEYSRVISLARQGPCDLKYIKSSELELFSFLKQAILKYHVPGTRC